MAEQVLIQFRVDKELKQEVAEIYDALGMDLPTAFRIFMKRSRMVRGIPFDTTLPENIVTRSEALNTFEELCRQAADVPEMSLEDINAEIHASRTSRKKNKMNYYAVIDTLQICRTFQYNYYVLRNNYSSIILNKYISHSMNINIPIIHFK